ncbi:MAG: DMT family transporter [Patescibacteria group bacterium]|jgi:drug/metabolite transporter (DMT)-like permease
MTWLYLSLGVAVCYACLNIFSRIVSVDSKNPRALSIAFNLVSTVMAIILLLFTGSFKNFSLPKIADAWIYLLIAAFFYGIFERLRFFATKMLDASIYSIIGNTSLIVAFTISIFLYKETLTISKLTGSLLILASLFMVVDKKKSKVSIRGVLVGLTACIAVGIAAGLDKKGAIYFSPEIYNLLLWVVPLIVLYFPGIKIKEIIDQFKKFSWKIVLLAFFNFVGYYLGLKAFLLADATRVLPIIQLSTIMTVIIGILFLNEKNHMSKKILAGIIAVVGVFLL